MMNKKLNQPIKNQKGIALILAMFTIVMVSFIASEISYETQVEAIVNGQAIHRVKAYYAARAGIELSLLRIKIYHQVLQQLPEQAKSIVKPELLDMIWNMPFSWPPMVIDKASEVEKDMIKETVDESKMDATYVTTITDEGSKIDVNDLNSPSKPVRESIKKQLIRIFEDKKKEDQNWARMNSDLNPEELINNIQDWVSPGRQSANGGDKSSRYSQLGEGYPPNRAFRTVEEVRLVPGMTEDAFALLRDQITVFGMKAINPNHASKEILMSLDPTITSKVAEDLVKRRGDQALGGQYKDAKDFWGYASTVGARVDPAVEENTPISCDSVFNFKIKAVGNVKQITSEITAIVFDLQKSANQVVKSMQKQSSQQGGGGGSSGSGTNPSQPAGQKAPPAKGPPRIVYWNER
jgi:general secretion pathway protein K